VQVPHQGFRADLCVLPMALYRQWVELNYGILTSGTQYVMIRGILMKQMWYASNLDIEEKPLLIGAPTLAEAQEKSYWIIWNALELSRPSFSVPIMDTTTTTVGMGKMQV